MTRSVQGALPTGPSLHRVTLGQCVSLSFTASFGSRFARVFAPLPQGSRSPAVTVGSKREPTRLWSQDAARRSRRLAQRRRGTAQGDRLVRHPGYRWVLASRRAGRCGGGAGRCPASGSGSGFPPGAAGAGWITLRERPGAERQNGIGELRAARTRIPGPPGRGCAQCQGLKRRDLTPTDRPQRTPLPPKCPTHAHLAASARP